MSQKISIKKNFIMSAILSMSAFIFPLITFPYVSRVLLPEGTGKVSFATSLVSYFVMIAQLGMPTYGIRACAKVREDKAELSKVTQELLMINVIMSVISYILFFAALALVPRLYEDRILYLIVGVTILFNAIGMEWLYKGLEQYTYITVRSLIFKVVALAAMFLLVHQKSDYVIYGAISVFAASASSVMNLLNARKFVNVKYAGPYNLKRHMKAVGIFFAMACATTVYTHLDTVMLGFMKSDTEVGYYNAAVRIKVILVSIVTSLGAVLLPRSSYYVEKGRMKEFHHITAKAMSFVWLFASALTVFFVIFAPQGIYFLSGRAYAGAIMPMRIIMPTMLIIGVSNIVGTQILVPLGREKWVLYAEIVGAFTNLLLNGLLIPGLGASGAAIGTVAAEFVVLLFELVLLRKDIPLMFAQVEFKKNTLGIVLAVIASLWTVRLQFVANTTWNSFLILAISAILFFGVDLLVLTVTRVPLVLEIEQQLLGKLKRR